MRTGLHRLKIAGGFGLLLFSNGGVLAQASQSELTIGEPQAAPTQPAQALWEVVCTSSQAGLDCRAGQSLPFEGAGGRLIVGLEVPPDTKIPVMLLRLPLGVYLPAGVSVRFGNDAAKQLPFESCDQNGCSAKYAITKAEIAAMLNGADVTISAQSLKRQPVVVRVPALGFSAAYAKIK
jgi:invasion protein IalB